jgi:hypothetical protein
MVRRSWRRRSRPHSPTAFSAPMERPPPSPPRPPSSHIHAGWMVSATQRRPARLPRRTVFSRCICRCSRMRARLSLHILLATHRFPDERTPIEATPLSSTLGRSLVRVWIWVWDWVHTSPRTLLDTLPSFLPPSFIQYPFPPCSLVCGGQTTWITVVILELIHAQRPDSRRAVFIRFKADIFW